MRQWDYIWNLFSVEFNILKNEKYCYFLLLTAKPLLLFSKGEASSIVTKSRMIWPSDYFATRSSLELSNYFSKFMAVHSKFKWARNYSDASKDVISSTNEKKVNKYLSNFLKPEKRDQHSGDMLIFFFLYNLIFPYKSPEY